MYKEVEPLQYKSRTNHHTEFCRHPVESRANLYLANRRPHITLESNVNTQYLMNLSGKRNANVRSRLHNDTEQRLTSQHCFEEDGEAFHHHPNALMQ